MQVKMLTTATRGWQTVINVGVAITSRVARVTVAAVAIHPICARSWERFSRNTFIILLNSFLRVPPNLRAFTMLPYGGCVSIGFAWYIYLIFGEVKSDRSHLLSSICSNTNKWGYRAALYYREHRGQTDSHRSLPCRFGRHSQDNKDTRSCWADRHNALLRMKHNQ